MRVGIFYIIYNQKYLQSSRSGYRTLSLVDSQCTLDVYIHVGYPADNTHISNPCMTITSMPIYCMTYSIMEPLVDRWLPSNPKPTNQIVPASSAKASKAPLLLYQNSSLYKLKLAYSH